jgi:hypothetical protein
LAFTNSSIIKISDAPMEIRDPNAYVELNKGTCP